VNRALGPAAHRWLIALAVVVVRRDASQIDELAEAWDVLRKQTYKQACTLAIEEAERLGLIVPGRQKFTNKRNL